MIWLLTGLSLLLGCWLQTAMGFGMAVVAAPIIVLLKPEWVPVLLTVNALVLSIFNTSNQRQHLQLRRMLLPLATRLPGTVIGAWLLLQLNVFWLQICVAGAVLFAVFISLFGRQFDYTPARLGTAAFISGIMGTTTSVGGPPMALVMQHGAPPTIRANLSLFFAYSCTISLISYHATGLLNARLLLESLVFVPVCLLGFYLGIRSRGFVDAGRFRPMLLILCGTAGGFALAGALANSGAL